MIILIQKYLLVHIVIALVEYPYKKLAAMQFRPDAFRGGRSDGRLASKILSLFLSLDCGGKAVQVTDY